MMMHDDVAVLYDDDNEDAGEKAGEKAGENGNDRSTTHLVCF